GQPRRPTTRPHVSGHEPIRPGLHHRLCAVRPGIFLRLHLAPRRRPVAHPTPGDRGHLDGRGVHGRALQTPTRPSHHLPAPSRVMGRPHARRHLRPGMGPLYRPHHLSSTTTILRRLSQPHPRRPISIRLLPRPGPTLPPHRPRI